MTNSQWNTIDTQEDLNKIILASHQSDQLIFKHSSSCGISSLVKNRLEKEDLAIEHHLPIHLIDVIRNREISNQLADHFKIRHESPQILLIVDDHCTFHTSHFDVSLKNIPISKEEK